MEEFFRSVGFGAGVIGGFLLLCYGFADFTISHFESIREYYEEEYLPESDKDVGKMLFLGFIEIVACIFVISMMYLIGKAFR